jgi:hypothetical protein
MMTVMTSRADTYDPSPAALRPLMETFWSAEGWRRPPAWPSPADMGNAIAANVMFSKARTEDHDGWVRAAIAGARRLSAQ